MITQHHTPGPWHVVSGPPNGTAVHWSPDGQICPMRWTDGLRPDVEARVMADARLIAAAPELLEAGKRILAECDGLFQLAEDQIVNTGDGWVCKSCGMELDSGVRRGLQFGGHKADCCANRILDLSLALHALEAIITKATQ